MIVHIADRKPKQIDPGTTRTVLSYGQCLMLVEVSLQPGLKVAPHKHPHEQVSYVLRGTVRFTIGDQNVIMNPGETCLIPPDVLHTAEALSDCTLLDAFSPPREDFTA